MCVSVKDVSLDDAEPFDLVTRLRVCNGCVAGYRSLSLVDRIEQLMRLREEALVAMHRLAAELAEAEAVETPAHSPNGEPHAPSRADPSNM